MDRAAVLRRCLALPGAFEEYPFGETTAVFKVGGKMFALVSLADEPGRLSVKCDPGYALALRDEHPGVVAGYHLDKRHWNTVLLDGAIPADMIAEWIEDSYGLVRASLTRRQRDTLADLDADVGAAGA